GHGLPSSEHPVQEPAGRLSLALRIETLAEYPVAMPILVLDAVVVARALPPLERGRAGEGVRRKPRCRHATPTRRWPWAIATLPLAGRGSSQLTPPFRGDALGHFGLDHAAAHLPPGEARGRAFGDLGQHGEGLRPCEEKRRTLGFGLPVPGRSRSTSCQGAPRALRQFGDMAFAWH